MLLFPHALTLKILFVTVDGQWGSFGRWSTCSKTCGGGIKTRQRLCDNPSPSNNGADCIGNATHWLNCSVNSCPGKKTTNILVIF